LQYLLEPLEAHIASEKALYSPLAYFCLFSLVFILERRIPARKQALLTAGVGQDIVWYVGSVGFRVAFLGFYLVLLQQIYQQYLAFLTLETFAAWGTPAVFLLAVLVDDFLTWLSHLVRHKVPLFWKFHAVHHSQAELNLFTDARVHPFDRMISATLRFIPFMMLGVDLPFIMAWAVFETVYPKFYHANVRLNFGPLRYILVTPQSHRIHHGRELEYRDKNFGRIFCVWDRLFGTHYSDDFEYPETGVTDPEFPHERAADPQSLFITFLRQLIYPFKQIAQLR
jgi:sterol desaturase/sphingolipid hydroxylase (fatty acid hydroxylase superfamily)